MEIGEDKKGDFVISFIAERIRKITHNSIGERIHSIGESILEARKGIRVWVRVLLVGEGGGGCGGGRWWVGRRHRLRLVEVDEISRRRLVEMRKRRLMMTVAAAAVRISELHWILILEEEREKERGLRDIWSARFNSFMGKSVGLLVHGKI